MCTTIPDVAAWLSSRCSNITMFSEQLSRDLERHEKMKKKKKRRQNEQREDNGVMDDTQTTVSLDQWRWSRNSIASH